MKLKKENFIIEVVRVLNEAKNKGDEYVEIVSKDIHENLGGYPSKSHNMPSCCDAMYELMRGKDEIISAPAKGKGASLKIRYYL